MKRLRQLAAAWSSDRCSRKAAALSYYAVFSFAPLIVVVVAVASWFVPDQLIASGLTDQARLLLGDGGAALVTQVLRNARTEHAAAGFAAIVGTVTFVIGATTAFGELKESLDDIWGVGLDTPGAFWSALGSRVRSFVLVLSLAFLLLLSLLLNSALDLFSNYFGAHLGVNGAIVLQATSQVSSFVVITLLFAVVYKVLPEIVLSWKDVALSALLTAALFMVGHALLGKFLNNSAAVSVFGKASSLAVMLLWIYYSSLIFFLGAEITKIWRTPAVVRKRRDGQRRGEAATAYPSIFQAGV